MGGGEGGGVGVGTNVICKIMASYQLSFVSVVR